MGHFFSRTALILLDGPLESIPGQSRGYWKFFYALVSKKLSAVGFRVRLLPHLPVTIWYRILQFFCPTRYLAEYIARVLVSLPFAILSPLSEVVIGVQGPAIIFSAINRLVGRSTGVRIFIFMYFSYRRGIIGFIKRRILRFCLGNPNVTLLCITPAQKQEFDKLALFPQQVRFIPYGIDVDFFQRAESSQSSEVNVVGTVPFILCPGDYERDDALLFRACRNLSIRIVRLTKEPGYERHILKLARQFEMSHRVEIIVGVSENEVRDLYRRCQFVVLPVRNALHPCGLTCLVEAMASEKATVVTRGLTSDYYSRSDIDALHYDADNAQSLRDQILRLMESEDLRDRLGSEARLRAVACFGIELNVDRFADLVLGQNEGRADPR